MKGPIRIANRVQQGERLPIDPNDVVRRLFNTPGVTSVSEQTSFHYDGKTVEVRSTILAQ